MKLTEMLEDVGRPMAYYPALAKCLGGVNRAVFACEFVYWKGKEADPEGWIYKTQAEIEEETGLTDDEQNGARAALKKAGILEEARKGLPAKLYYRLNTDKLNEAWENQATMRAERLETNRQRTAKAREARLQNRKQADCPTSNKDSVPQNSKDSVPQTTSGMSDREHSNIQMTTTETTHETTHNSAPVGAVCDEFLLCQDCGTDRVTPMAGRTDIGTCSKCSGKTKRMVNLIVGAPKRTPPKSVKRPAAPSADAKAVMDKYAELYVAKFVSRPQFVANDYKAVEELILNHGKDAVLGVLPGLLDEPDEYAKKAGWHLYLLPHRWNSLSAAAAPIAPVVIIDASHAKPNLIDAYFHREVSV